PRQKLRAAAHREEPVIDLEESESRPLARDAQVTAEGELESAAQAETVDGGDDGSVQVAECAERLLAEKRATPGRERHWRSRGRAGAGPGGEPGLLELLESDDVRAGAEGAAVARDDDRAHPGLAEVARQRIEPVQEIVRQEVRRGIADREEGHL